VKKYKLQVIGNSWHDQRDLFINPHRNDDRLPIKKHRNHQRDPWYRHFCAVFGPTLKTMLPVNKEASDAILTHIYENLPYPMRPPPTKS
jgi:hypothetical protein